MTQALEASLSDDPIVQLHRWLDDATAERLIEPSAMCLATATRNGTPSSRMVLLRGLDARGLVFFTSYLSRKGRILSENPDVSLTFYWPQLHRQIHVHGRAAELAEDESDAYFAARPRGHQLAAWASEQSAPIESRDVLEDRLDHFDERFAEEEVPRPHSWGGYLVTPDRFEFWQSEPNRLHDRIEYTRAGTTWRKTRLQP
jgi:pyridoxamine 5'-phosphate oxidase